jgi:acetolactate synthase-1/2/3 large subunit
MQKLVSDLMVDYLERRGVEHIFGLCGHTVNRFFWMRSRGAKKYNTFPRVMSRWLPPRPTGMPA